MMLVTTSDLVESFNQWAGQLATQNDLADWVSIDGKCLRSTCKNSDYSSQNFVSIVSLFTQTSGWVFKLQNFQKKKSLEIGQVQELVRDYPRLRASIYELAKNVGCDRPLKNIAFLVVGEVHKKALQSLN